MPLNAIILHQTKKTRNNNHQNHISYETDYIFDCRLPLPFRSDGNHGVNPSKQQKYGRIEFNTGMGQDISQE